MKKICVLTGTRAEYGLLYHTMKAIGSSPKLTLQLVVTGSHLSPAHGMTVETIKKDGFKIDCEIDMLLNSADKSAIAKSMGLLMIQLAGCFDTLRPDMLLILGDRYEILAAASCAVAMNIPIAHIGGGEITEGAIDEQVRHAVTKMAHIHFTSTGIYRQNIIKMGEEELRVFNVGAPVCENIRKTEFLPLAEIEKRLNIKIIRPMFVITHHPETLSSVPVNEQITALLSALDGINGTFIFTGANADFGGDTINEALKKYAVGNDNSYFFQSLGNTYLSLCKHADAMLGNSSSGIIEAPCMRLPVVNIGERQRGRLRHVNIIDVENDAESIRQGIQKAVYDEEFKKAVSVMDNLYGDGTVSDIIVKTLEDIEIDKRLMLKKLAWGR